MLEYDPEQSLGYWLVRCARALRASMRAELAPHGITERQWEVLAWLAIDGACCQAELARRMEVETPTLARILDRMERDGWVERRPCDDDRRKKQIHPTDQVEGVWQTMVGCAQRVRARARLGLSEPQVAQLRGLLRTVLANLETSTDAGVTT